MPTADRAAGAAPPEMAARLAHVAEAQVQLEDELSHVAEVRHELDDELSHVAGLRRELEHAEQDVQHKIGGIYSELARLCALDAVERQTGPTDR